MAAIGLHRIPGGCQRFGRQPLVPPRPDAIRSSEVGQAGFCADAGTGKKNRVLGRVQVLRQGLDLFIRFRVHEFAPNIRAINQMMSAPSTKS